MTGTAQRVDPRRYLEPLWRRRWLVLAILIVVPAAAYGASKLVTPRYEASTTLLVRSTNFSSQAFTQQVSVATGSAAAAARLVQTTPVAAAAARVLGESPAEARALLGEIAVDTDDTDTTSQFLTITASADDPDRAAAIANAFARAITRTRTEDAVAEIDKTIATLEGQRAGEAGESKELRAELDSQLQQLRGLRASQQGTTEVIEPALPPAAPVSPRPLRNTILALLGALILVAIVVPLADRFSRRLRDPDELEPATGAQLLAMIPESAFPGHPPSAIAKESFQTLRASLRYFNLDRSLSIVLITSPAHADGKTTVSTNLALAMARDGADVVLLDADLRRPQAARRLGLDGGYGAEAVIVDRVPLDEALQEVDAGGGSLRVLASVDPSPNPAPLLGSARMRELLAELTERHDTVIIDTPPVLAVADAVPLLSVASGVVLVSRVGQTGIDAILRTNRIISSAEGRLLGNVATGVRDTGGLYSYGSYGYGYEYAAPSSSE